MKMERLYCHECGSSKRTLFKNKNDKIICIKCIIAYELNKQYIELSGVHYSLYGYIHKYIVVSNNKVNEFLVSNGIDLNDNDNMLNIDELRISQMELVKRLTSIK